MSIDILDLMSDSDTYYGNQRRSQASAQSYYPAYATSGVYPQYGYAGAVGAYDARMGYKKRKQPKVYLIKSYAF